MRIAIVHHALLRRDFASPWSCSLTNLVCVMRILNADYLLWYILDIQEMSFYLCQFGQCIHPDRRGVLFHIYYLLDVYFEFVSSMLVHYNIAWYRHSLEPLYSIPRPRTRSQTPIYKSPTCSHTQSHWRFSSTFPPSCPRLNVILTQQTHSLQATDSPHTHLCCPPSGATHHFLITGISIYYNPNVLE